MFRSAFRNKRKAEMLRTYQVLALLCASSCIDSPSAPALRGYLCMMWVGR